MKFRVLSVFALISLAVIAGPSLAQDQQQPAAPATRQAQVAPAVLTEAAAKIADLEAKLKEKEAALAAKTKEAEASDGAVICALMPNEATRPGCFLDLLVSYPGTKAAGTAKAEVNKVIAPVLVSPTQPALSEKQATSIPAEPTAQDSLTPTCGSVAPLPSPRPRIGQAKPQPSRTRAAKTCN